MSKITDKTNQYVFSLFNDYATYPIDSDPRIYSTQSPVSIMNEKFEFFCVEKRILEPQFIIPHSCCWWYHHNFRNSQKSTILYISSISFLGWWCHRHYFLCVCVDDNPPEEDLMRKGRFLVLLEWVSEKFSPPFCTCRIVLILVSFQPK